MSDRLQGVFDRLPLRRNQDRVRQARRLSRRDRELRQRRILLVSMLSVTALVGLLLVGGALYEYGFRPREVLATVNGYEIRRGDYWKMRRYSLLNQIRQYQFFAAQNPQYAAQIQQLQRELTTYKEAPVDPQTLTGMIDDRVVLQRLDQLGLSITDEEVQNYLQESFAPVPLSSPTPSPTVNPTAAAWATQTASAAAATASRPAQGTPGAAPPGMPGTPGTPAGAGTPVTSGGEPAVPATPATPAAFPSASRTPGTPTLAPTATPNREQALATATAGLGQTLETLEERAGLSREDYLQLVVRPALARQEAQEKFAGEIKDVQPQVHAAHILLATRDGAEQARRAVTEEGKDFAEVARQQSTDTSTAPNGGDLGWFPRGVMVKEFEDAAFSLQPGEVSQPVQTKFGWHIIKVLEKDEARPVLPETLEQLRQGAFQKWLDAQKASSTIVSDLPVTTPTPATDQFEAPPGAPPTPAPTPRPAPTPVATPPALG